MSESVPAMILDSAIANPEYADPVNAAIRLKAAKEATSKAIAASKAAEEAPATPTEEGPVPIVAPPTVDAPLTPRVPGKGKKGRKGQTTAPSGSPQSPVPAQAMASTHEMAEPKPDLKEGTTEYDLAGLRLLIGSLVSRIESKQDSDDRNQIEIRKALGTLTSKVDSLSSQVAKIKSEKEDIRKTLEKELSHLGSRVEHFGTIVKATETLLKKLKAKDKPTMAGLAETMFSGPSMATPSAGPSAAMGSTASVSSQPLGAATATSGADSEDDHSESEDFLDPPSDSDLDEQAKKAAFLKSLLM